MLGFLRNLLKRPETTAAVRQTCTIRPFKGYVANQDYVGQIIAPAYDTLNSEEARQMAAGNEKSFLHVNKPEIDLPREQDPYSDEVYAKGRENLEKWCDNGWLVRDDVDTMYVYQLTMGEHTQTALVHLASTHDYAAGRIKRHEFTLAKKEKDRTDLTDRQSANVGPCFLTYKENQDAIRNKLHSISQNQECYADVTTDDGVRHALWKVSESDARDFESEYSKVNALYIADGHHRCAAANGVANRRREALGDKYTGEEDWNFFMTLSFPADDLLVLDYNRVLKDLNGLSSDEFKEKLSEIFTIEEMAEGSDTKVRAQHEFNMLLDNKWYRCVLRPERLDNSTPVSRLDSQILTDQVLSPLLGIHDLKKDTRIDFVGGIRGHKELERRCKDDCVAAFALYPCSVAELLDVADANLIMPPKSTWFEPKPRSGFVVNRFSDVPRF